jgi:hypothetical protein
MWRELVEAGDGIGARLADAAPEGAIAETGRTLGVALPGTLSSLLAETDGITDQFGYGVVWPVRELVDRNREMRETDDFRELYMPFDCLVFFGEIGNGDLVGFRVLRGETPDDVYLWNHETDSRLWLAASLEQYVRRRLTDWLPESGR